MDIDLVKRITAALGIPVIARGGAGTLDHIGEAVPGSGASAVALGRMVVFQMQDMGVLVIFSDRMALSRVIA